MPFPLPSPPAGEGDSRGSASGVRALGRLRISRVGGPGKKARNADDPGC
jgi:hypothetical protein